MDKRKTGLIKNTAILAVGNFSTKLMVFFLVPLYTYYLPLYDYGKFELYLTELSIIYIIFSFQSVEIVFRFIQDCKNDKQITSTVSNALVIALLGITLFTIGMAVFSAITKFQYCLLFILHVASNILSNMFLQIIRGMNKTMLYTAVTVISTFVQIAVNIIFVVGVGIGATVMLISPIIVNTFIIAILILKEKFLSNCKISAINYATIKEQLKFSLPLIPNALSIWFLSSIGRFILLFYYGTEAVGLLVFVLKFPQLLSTINSIFFMAWQVSIISEFDSEDKDSFASEVFQHYSSVLLSSILIILPLIKLVIFNIMGESYVSAWVYIPIFFVGVIFGSFAQFYNTGFYGAKKTGNVFVSALISSTVYIIIGIILAKPIYIFGVGIAYSISEFIRWLVVKNKVSQYMKVKINIKQQVLIAILAGVFTVSYYIAGIWMQVIMCIIGILLFFYINRVFVFKIVKVLKLIDVK